MTEIRRTRLDMERLRDRAEWDGPDSFAAAVLRRLEREQDE